MPVTPSLGAGAADCEVAGRGLIRRNNPSLPSPRRESHKAHAFYINKSKIGRNAKKP